MISLLREEKLKAEFKTKEHLLTMREHRHNSAIARKKLDSPYADKAAIRYLEDLPQRSDYRSSTLSTFSTQKSRSKASYVT